MRTISTGVALSLLFLVSVCLSQSTVPRAGHVVLIIEENHQFSQVYPSGMPWIVSQAQADGGIATNFTSSIGSFQSLGAYLWLSSEAPRPNSAVMAVTVRNPSRTTTFFANSTCAV